MQRLLIAAGVLLVCAALVGAIGTVVSAQVIEPDPGPALPQICFPMEHDLNRDGKVNEFDFNLWKDWLFAEGDECELGAAASACPAGMDANGDGIITFDDLDLMLLHYKLCILKASDDVRRTR